MAETGVKENLTGTIPEEEGQTQVPPEKAGKTPEKASKVSPKEEELIYSQRQADELTHAARSDAGRGSKEWETKFNTSEKKMTGLTSKLEGIEGERDKLQKDLEDMSSDDPKRYDIITRDRDLRQRENDTRDKITGLEERETGISEREKKVSSFELELLVETVVEDYEDGDKKRLKDAVSTFDKPTEEQVRHLAGIIFGTKSETAKTPKRYSGKSDGGGGAIYTRAQIKDRAFWMEHRDDINKAIAEPGQPRLKD